MKPDLTHVKQSMAYLISHCKENEVYYAEIWDFIDDVKKLIEQLEEKR